MREQDHLTELEEYVINFVTELRSKKNLTQEDIGNIISADRSFISNVERRIPGSKYNIKHIALLSDYFNISPRLFFPEKPIPVK